MKVIITKKEVADGIQREMQVKVGDRIYYSLDYDYIIEIPPGQKFWLGYIENNYIVGSYVYNATYSYEQ